MNTDTPSPIKKQVDGFDHQRDTSSLSQNRADEIGSSEIKRPHRKHLESPKPASTGEKQYFQTAQSWTKMKLASLVKTIRSICRQETGVQNSVSQTKSDAAAKASFNPAALLAKPPLPERITEKRMEIADKTREMTKKLNFAIETSNKTGNHAILKLTIQEVENAFADLVSKENKPDPALIPSILQLQTKLQECKEKKSDLPSEKAQVFNTILQDLIKNNKANEGSIEDIRAEFKAQGKGFSKNEQHQIQIREKTYVISRDSEVQLGTVIPSIWKKEEEHFAEGGVAQIFGGNWIVNPKNKEDLVMKVGMDETTSWKDMINELSVTQAVHKTGVIPGVVPTPALVSYKDQVSILMRRQDMDGVGLSLTRPAERFTEGELKEIVSKSTNGLHAIHKAGYYHGDGKGKNLLWNEGSKNLMVADLGGARKFEEIFSTTKFPNMDDVMGNYTYFSPGINKKIEGVLLQREAEFQLAGLASQFDVQKSILKNLMNEIEPLLIANDQYTHGLALCDSLIPSFVIPCGDISTSEVAKKSIEIQMERASVPREVKEIIYPLLNGVSRASSAERLSVPELSMSFKTPEVLQNNLEQIIAFIKLKPKEERPKDASQIINFMNPHLNHMLATNDPSFATSKQGLIESLNTIKTLLSENPHLDKKKSKLPDQTIARINGDDNREAGSINSIKIRLRRVPKNEIAASGIAEGISKDIEILTKNSSLTKTDKEELKNLIANYKDVFIENLNLNGLPETGLTTASLNKALKQLE